MEDSGSKDYHIKKQNNNKKLQCMKHALQREEQLQQCHSSLHTMTEDEPLAVNPDNKIQQEILSSEDSRITIS